MAGTKRQRALERWKNGRGFGYLGLVLRRDGRGLGPRGRRKGQSFLARVLYPSSDLGRALRVSDWSVAGVESGTGQDPVVHDGHVVLVELLWQHAVGLRRCAV